MARWIAVFALLVAAQALSVKKSNVLDPQKSPEEVQIEMPEEQPGLSMRETDADADETHTAILRAEMKKAIQRVAHEKSHRAAVNKSKVGDHPDFGQWDCLDDPHNEQHDKAHFDWRDSLLKQWKSQQWKYKKETLDAYQNNPKIKKIYFISQDGGRINFMEEGLKYTNIPHEHFQAYGRGAGRHEDFSNGDVAQYLWDSDGGTRDGTIGVYNSHANLMKKIRDEEGDASDIYAIMEDDVGLNPNWDFDLTEMVKMLPPDWDIARFVYWGVKRCQDSVPWFREWQTETKWYEALTPDNIGGINAYAGNQAYLIRKGSTQEVFDSLDDLPVMDFDGAVGSTHQLYTQKVEGIKDPIAISWGLYTYVTTKPLGTHMQFGTQRER